jgi:hypothetical protein
MKSDTYQYIVVGSDQPFGLSKARVHYQKSEEYCLPQENPEPNALRIGGIANGKGDAG